MKNLKGFYNFINEQVTSDSLTKEGFSVVTDANKKKEIENIIKTFDKNIDLGASPVFYFLKDKLTNKSYRVIKGNTNVYTHEEREGSADYHKSKTVEDALNWIKSRQTYREIKK